MKRNQEYTENEVNAPINSHQAAEGPKSAHSNPVAEKYVNKRKDKAEKQVEHEHRTDSFWGAIKYVIL